MDQKIEVETNYTPETENFVKKAMPGIADFLNSEKIKTAKPIPVDDLTFQRLAKLGALSGIENMTREEAERYHGIIIAAGLDVNMLSAALTAIPPEQLKKFAESLPRP